MKILKQGWYKEIVKRWHEDDKFNYTGEHVTQIDLNGKEVDRVFCVRNPTTSLTVIFTDGTYFTYDVVKSALYLDSKFEIIKNILIVKVELSWYTLGYSILGKRLSKEYLYKI